MGEICFKIQARKKQRKLGTEFLTFARCYEHHFEAPTASGAANHS
jgi:hypothetical protein